jgi:hypothetical protein
LCSRIAKGISLVKKYHSTENINMWTTSRSREGMLSFFYEHRLWLESTNSYATAMSTGLSNNDDEKDNETSKTRDATCRCKRFLIERRR